MTIRIYVSSTFSDMHAEREILMEYVFPQLQERCQEHKIQLEECDLRFRAEEDQTSMEVCRQEIEKCHLFLGLLGEHYGYIPPDESISVTHDEILYALFDSKNPNSLRNHCLFYFRHPKGSLQVPLEDWAEYWEDEDTERFRSLKALKQKIRISSVPVYDYYGYWNEDQCPPWNEGKKGFFEKLESFAEKVLEHLWQEIQKIAQESPQPKEATEVRPSFSMEEVVPLYTKTFVGREEYLESMLQFCHETGSGYYMLHGTCGTGKSALMAKFYEEFLKTIQDQENPPLVLKHFIGSIPCSCSIVSLLDGFCRSLIASGAVCSNYSADYEALQEIFPDLLSQVALQRKVILVIDNLNELHNFHNALDFYWLPRFLPENVKILVSFLSGTEEQNFKKRFRCRESEVLPLKREEAIVLIKSYLQQSEKVVSEESIQILLSNKEICNPLFLILALEECKALGGKERILQIKDIASSFPENIHAMMVCVMLRMEKEFGDKIMGAFFKNIAVSRNGIKKQHIQILLEKEAGALSKAFYMKLFQQMKPYLITMGDYILLFHNQMKDSISGQYLLLEETKISVHKSLAEFYEKQGYKCREALGELPYHLYHAKEWEKLLRLMSNLEFLENKVSQGMASDLYEDFEMLLGKNSRLPQDARFAWGEESQEGEKIGTENLPVVSSDTKEFALLASQETLPRCIIDKNTMQLIFKALALELSFLLKNPESLFASIWNRCYWYDSPKTASHYEVQSHQDKRKLPWFSKSSKIYILMEKWRLQKETQAEFVWLKSLKPIIPPLDSPLAKVFRGHLGVNHIAFSKDGKKIVSSSLDNTARIWDIETGICLQILKGHTQWVEGVAFSPNGQEVISSSKDKTIRMWDVESGKCVRTFRGHTNGVRGIAYSPEGRRIASASFDETIRVWDTGTGDCLKVIKGHEGPVHCVTFTKDGKKIASSSRDNTIRIWEWETGRCLKILKGHTNWIESIALSPDDTQIVSGSDDNTIRIWNAIPADSVAASLGNWFKEAGSLFKSSADCIKVFQGHENKVNSVCFSPDGTKILSGSSDKTIRIWNVETGENIRTFLGHEDYINAVAFSPCGKKIASASQDKTICLWDLQGDIPALIPKEHHDTVTDVSFDKAHKILASSSQDKTIRLWELETGICSKILKGHEESVTSVVFSPEKANLLASGSMDKTLRLWDIEKEQCIKTMNAHHEGISNIRFSPDGKFIATASYDKTIRYWNVSESKCIQVLEGHSDAVLLVFFSQDGKSLISLGEEKKIHVWNLSSGKVLHVLEGHSSLPYRIFFDSQNMVSVSEEEAKIWQIETGKCLETIPKSEFSKLALLQKELCPVPGNSETGIVSPSKNIVKWREGLEKAQISFPYISGLSKSTKSYTPLLQIQGNPFAV